jgi:hypothetical protein
MYKICGLIIDSDFDLLEEVSNRKNDKNSLIRFTLSSGNLYKPSKWFMQWYLPRGKLWLSFAKVDDGYLLRFNEYADFFVSYNGKNIVCTPKGDTPSNTIRHLLLDQVIPLVINLRRGEALHASAVLTPKGTIAFIGTTGSGKSTLAGSFLQEGYPIMSDDCLSLVKKNKSVYAIQAYLGLRLWEDTATRLFGKGREYNSVAHYTNKHQIDIKPIKNFYYDGPQLLKRIYTIGSPSKENGKNNILIKRLSSKESFMTLVQFAFRLDITDRIMLKRQFHFLERVASRVSVRRLIYPRNFNLLPAVREAILNDLKDLDN